jgi:hypothetical protein
VKRIGSLLARWEGVKRLSRSQGERIRNKMELCSSVGLRNTKRGCEEDKWAREGSLLLLRKSILLLFGRAGLLNNILFFY